MVQAERVGFDPSASGDQEGSSHRCHGLAKADQPQGAIDLDRSGAYHLAQASRGDAPEDLDLPQPQMAVHEADQQSGIAVGFCFDERDGVRVPADDRRPSRSRSCVGRSASLRFSVNDCGRGGDGARRPSHVANCASPMAECQSMYFANGPSQRRVAVADYLSESSRALARGGRSAYIDNTVMMPIAATTAIRTKYQRPMPLLRSSSIGIFYRQFSTFRCSAN